MNPLTFNHIHLEDFKLGFTDTLFQPTWEALTTYHCPLCSNKLRFIYKKRLALCTSKKHGKAFVIGFDRLKAIIGTLPEEIALLEKILK